jgi:hypothetical protein
VKGVSLPVRYLMIRVFSVPVKCQIEIFILLVYIVNKVSFQIKKRENVGTNKSVYENVELA